MVVKGKDIDRDKVLRAQEGTPQGGVLSPLLANIYLHPPDKYWQERHQDTKLVRYCDDKDRSRSFCYGFPTQKAMKRVRENLTYGLMRGWWKRVDGNL
ncbi:MAG: reverse transcriptase domain-containing protein [Acidobacteriota bacterium]